MLVSRIGRKDKVRLFILLFLLCIFAAGCGGEYDTEEGFFYLYEKVILDYPPEGELSEGEITFRWHLENDRDGITYNYTILFDKGVNPFDGCLEYSVETGEATEYTINMSADWWSGFVWGVTVQTSDGYVKNSSSRWITLKQ